MISFNSLTDSHILFVSFANNIPSLSFNSLADSHIVRSTGAVERGVLRPFNSLTDSHTITSNPNVCLSYNFQFPNGFSLKYKRESG